MRILKYLIINFICFLTFAISQDVNLQITNYSDNVLELYMQNSEPVAGLQFDVDSSLDSFSITSASGGSMQAAGFTISNSATRIIGFSLTGSNIAPGEGVCPEGCTGESALVLSSNRRGQPGLRRRRPRPPGGVSASPRRRPRRQRFYQVLPFLQRSHQSHPYP